MLLRAAVTAAILFAFVSEGVADDRLKPSHGYDQS